MPQKVVRINLVERENELKLVKKSVWLRDWVLESDYWSSGPRPAFTNCEPWANNLTSLSFLTYSPSPPIGLW